MQYSKSRPEWGVLQKSWLGYKIAKNQEDEKEMRYYAAGIQKVQKELGLEVEMFPNLGMCGIDSWQHGSDIGVEDDVGEENDDAKQTTNEDDIERTSYGYESEAQRRWRERMEKYY